MTQFLWHTSVTQLFSPGAMQVIGAACGSGYSSWLDWRMCPVLWKQSCCGTYPPLWIVTQSEDFIIKASTSSSKLNLRTPPEQQLKCQHRIRLVPTVLKFSHSPLS